MIIENKLKLNNYEMENFIWMSYRYCIGRKTIAAAMHAETIYKLLVNNPDLLSDNRKKFMATDIRRGINETIRYKNVTAGCGDYDAFSTLLYAIDEFHKETHKFDWSIENAGNYIEITPRKGKELQPWESFEAEYTDLIGWVKLANFLDKSCHKTVKIYYDNDFIEYEAYSYPQKINEKYQKVWCSIDQDFDGWLDPMYIEEIKDL